MRRVLHIVLTAVLFTGCVQNNDLTVANSTDISTLDPFGMFSRIEVAFGDHLYQSLTFFNDDMEVEPLLATSWERLEGDTTWTFHLREGVQFHNGEVFDASVVKYSIEEYYTRNEAGQMVGGASVAVPSADIIQVDIVDPYTVNITTNGPKALLPFYLSQMWMIEPGFYRGTTDAERAEQVMGTGPYVVNERIRDSHLTLAANTNYWGATPKMDRVVFRVIPEVSTRIAELETGGVHIITDLPFDQAALLEDASGIHVEAIPGGRRIMMGITTAGGAKPLQDQRVRQALNYAIDFDAISEGLFGSQVERMSYMFNPPFNHPTLESYTYDPDLARALLAEAGYPDGFVLSSLDTPIGKWIQDFELAQVVASQLGEIGVTLQEGVRTYEWGNYRSKLLSYDLPGLFMQGSGGEFELLTEAADLTITSPSNFYRWENEEYEALWIELQTSLDNDRRTTIGHRMQEIVHEEAPWIFLHIQPDTYGVSDRVDWKPRPDEVLHLWNVTLSE
ncbi:MAG: hypothetical protein HOB33_04850 [Bacteroidetes Order II. Incertae sedis bacterium]|nr:hypothetical protein [Bacteroidetes Order II. bacterium]